MLAVSVESTGTIRSIRKGRCRPAERIRQPRGDVGLRVGRPYPGAHLPLTSSTSEGPKDLVLWYFDDHGMWIVRFPEPPIVLVGLHVQGWHSGPVEHLAVPSRHHAVECEGYGGVRGPTPVQRTSDVGFVHDRVTKSPACGG